MLDAAERLAGHVLPDQHGDAAADVLGKVADAFQLVGDAEQVDDVPRVDSYRMTRRDGRDRALVNAALQVVDGGVGSHDALRAVMIARDQGFDRIGELLLGAAAHLGDHLSEREQIGVERLCCVDANSHRHVDSYPRCGADLS